MSLKDQVGAVQKRLEDTLARYDDLRRRLEVVQAQLEQRACPTCGALTIPPSSSLIEGQPVTCERCGARYVARLRIERVAP